MPKGTKVHKMYEALKKQGYSVESAVKIAQAKTGQALATGKAPKTNNAKKAVASHRRDDSTKRSLDGPKKKTQDIRQRKFVHTARLDRKHF